MTTKAGEGLAIILVRPQLGENIGSAARAMLNCGLADLRLVEPRDGWPNERARASASGAVEVLDRVRLFSSLEDALADLHVVYATSARLRDQVKPVETPRQAATALHARVEAGHRCGLVFGPERTGLENDEVTLANVLVHVPLNPAFSSLNLAQAVLLLGYEWYQTGLEVRAEVPAGAAKAAVEEGDGEPLEVGSEALGAKRRSRPNRGSRPATHAEMMNFFRRFEDALYEGGFLFPPELAPTMVRNLRNVFLRAEPTDQELRTLHGAVSALVRPKRRGGKPES